MTSLSVVAMRNLLPISLVSYILFFTLKDLSDLSYFFGIQVQRDDDSFHLNQHKYVMSLVTKVSLASTKSLPTSMSSTTRLSKCDGDFLDDLVLYQQLVGSLQYCVLTHPEIAFLVGKFC